METIRFKLEDGNETDEVFVLAQTTMCGIEYFLVSEINDDGVCYILKDVSDSNSSDACFVEVTDQVEWDALSKIFQTLVEDDYDLNI